MQSASETAPDEPPTAPAVRVVIPTARAGSWFDATLRSLDEQDHPGLRVSLVHEPGEQDLLTRHVERYDWLDLVEADEGAGFGAKVNMGVEASDEQLLLICHDDIAMAPGVVATLVGEWSRRGERGTIVSPKLVDWNDPARLVPAGFDADRFGATAALVKPGDLDQGQQERVTEVFGASTACLLIGREFFEALGGFDPAIDWHGEAHDLCLRARIAGGTVVLTAGAVVRHRTGFADRGGAPETFRTRRHQMRSVLVTSSGPGMIPLLLSFAVLHVVEFVVAMARLDLAELGAIPGAWLWNLGNVRSLFERRHLLAPERQIGTDELRSLRRGGSIRISESIDRRISQREEARERGEQPFSVVSAGGGVVIALILLFGARHLLTRTIPAIGEFRAIPGDLGTLTEGWWSGWRLWGMGGEGFAPMSLPLLDLAGLLTLGSDSLLRMIVVVAPLPIGVIGAWRLFHKTSSPRAPVVAGALYAASPLPYNAMSGGSLRALLLYASLPWIVAHLIGVSRSELFGERGHRAVSVFGLVVLLAGVGAFVPWVAVTFAVVVIGLVFGSFLGGDMRGVPALLTVSVLALAGATLLNLPYLLEISEWAQFGSAQTAAGNNVSLVTMLTASTGPVGSEILGWAVFAPALLPVLIGRGQRFSWGLRVWGLMLATWALAWLGATGRLPVGLPEMEVLLAPAAIGMAMLGGLAALVIERDLVDGGRATIAPAVVAAFGFGIALLPLLDGSFSGRWELARVDLTTTYAAIEAPAEEGTYRVVWIADPHVLGGAGLPTANDLAWMTSLDGQPDITALWSGGDGAATAVLGEAVTAGLDGRTSRLGRELSRFGVRYIVVMDQQAPIPEVSRRTVVSDNRAAGLASQLDLVRTGVVNPAVVVYENTAWAPVHTAVAPIVLETLRLDDPAPAVTVREDHDTWSGQVRVTRSLYAAWEPSERWVLEVGGRVMPRVDLGSVGMGFDTSSAGEETAAVFDYRTSDAHRLILGAQVAAWVVVAFLRRWIVGRERRQVRLLESRAERA